MLLYHLFPLAGFFITTHAWELNATLANGKTYSVRLSTGPTLDATNVPLAHRRSISSPVHPLLAPLVIELYSFDNCVSTKRVGLPGINNENSNMAYIVYRVVS